MGANRNVSKRKRKKTRVVIDLDSDTLYFDILQSLLNEDIGTFVKNADACDILTSEHSIYDCVGPPCRRHYPFYVIYHLPKDCIKVRQERLDLETERMRVVQAARESRRPITGKLKPQHWATPASSENAPKKAAKVK